MPVISVYISDEDAKILNWKAKQLHRQVVDLCEAAIADCESMRLSRDEYKHAHPHERKSDL